MIEARAEHRLSVDRLIPLIDVKRTLAVSWPMLIELVREGTLTVYDITGCTVDLTQVTEHTRGLRVLETDLKAYIDSLKVK